MRTFRSRLSRRTTARLLDQKSSTGDALSMLLTAAAAPVAVDPGREDLAVARFAEATRLGHVPTVEGGSIMARIVRKVVAAPVAALGAAGLVVAGGGLALAASHGALNVPFSGHDHRSDKAPAAPATANPGLTRAPAATPTALPTPSGTPTPSLTGLCRAFQAGASPSASNPAFAALTSAAGGTENVAAYCVDLIGPSKKPTHPAHPTTPAHPTAGAHPTTPAHPTAGAHPSKPASPGRGVEPTIPPKPDQAH